MIIIMCLSRILPPLTLMQFEPLRFPMATCPFVCPLVCLSDCVRLFFLIFCSSACVVLYLSVYLCLFSYNMNSLVLNFTIFNFLSCLPSYLFHSLTPRSPSQPLHNTVTLKFTVTRTSEREHVICHDEKTLRKRDHVM